MATIEDVANLAGVSIATVSRVLNNSYIVSQEKKERVLAAVKELNYQPLRQSRRTQNKIILVSGTSLFEDVLDGMKDEAKKLDYDLVYCRCDSMQELMSMTIVANELVDGIILMNMIASKDELRALFNKVPFVQAGEFLNIPHSFTVSIHELRAANEIVNHLISLGRKRIAMVVPLILGKAYHFIHEREMGYRLALAEADIKYDPKLRIQADFSTTSGMDAARKILALEERPDAVFCTTDTLATGCITVFHQHGIRIPEDIAVTGFDNAEFAELCSPSLTTIDQPFYEIGCECVQLLLSLINGRSTEIGRHVMIEHKLKLGASTIGQEAYKEITRKALKRMDEE